MGGRAEPEVPDGLVLVGVVARTHGLRGEVAVNLETDFPEQRFREGARLRARRRGGADVETLEIETVRFHQGRPLVRFVGYPTIDEAEALAGTELFVVEADLGPLPEGMYYHHQLLGCEVVDAAGEAIGSVAAVEGDMAASRLVVRSRRGEVLIPLTPAICQVDVAARRVVVTPPEGLLELNGDWRS
ncbi:MAG: ribosome maturation factor RimM [Vicinamibacterales bacterium]